MLNVITVDNQVFQVKIIKYTYQELPHPENTAYLHSQQVERK
jgi:hypothetical protein